MRSRLPIRHKRSADGADTLSGVWGTLSLDGKRGVAKRSAIAAAIGSLALVEVSSAFAAAPNPQWVAKANAACRLCNQKAVVALGGNPTEPSTPKEIFKLMLKIRPIASGGRRARATPGVRSEVLRGATTET